MKTIPSQTPALRVRGLHKPYKGGLIAFEGSTSNSRPGRFVGLLGPNGAGKSTLIGSVCNRDPHHRRDPCVRPRLPQPRARSLIGLAEQEVNLDRFLSVEQTLVYHGGYHGLRRARRSGERVSCWRCSVSATRRSSMDQLSGASAAGSCSPAR